MLIKSHISDYFIYPLRQLLADSERYSYFRFMCTGAQTVNKSCTLLLLLRLLDRFRTHAYNIQYLYHCSTETPNVSSLFLRTCSCNSAVAVSTERAQVT